MLAVMRELGVQDFQTLIQLQVAVLHETQLLPQQHKVALTFMYPIVMGHVQQDIICPNVCAKDAGTTTAGGGSGTEGGRGTTSMQQASPFPPDIPLYWRLSIRI
jgi:hypothetical protein